MAAALLKAVAKANAAIGKHAEISLLLSADRNDRGVGRGVAQGGAGAGGDAGASEVCWPRADMWPWLISCSKTKSLNLL